MLKEQSFVLTSPQTVNYNCIAWAAGDYERWWWPDSQNLYYWPLNAPRKETIEAFVECFNNLGYVDHSTDSLEPSFSKLALYVDAYGKPTHAARQLLSGEWTSKLGREHDVKHSLSCLEGSSYGSVGLILKKQSIKDLERK